MCLFSPAERIRVVISQEWGDVPPQRSWHHLWQVPKHPLSGLTTFLPDAPILRCFDVATLLEWDLSPGRLPWGCFCTAQHPIRAGFYKSQDLFSQPTPSRPLHSCLLHSIYEKALVLTKSQIYYLNLENFRNENWKLKMKTVSWSRQFGLVVGDRSVQDWD